MKGWYVPFQGLEVSVNRFAILSLNFGVRSTGAAFLDDSISYIFYYGGILTRSVSLLISF